MVTIEIGVERCTNKRMQLNCLTFYKDSLFAPHAFEPQRQLQSSKPPSPLVFLLISTHFTATLGIPLTSPALKSNSFQSSTGVEPRAFTSDLLNRLRSLYTQ